MTKRKITSFQQTLADLGDLYQKALDQDNVNLAVKIKELQSRILGFFHPKDTFNPTSLSDETLQTLIQQLEQQSLNK